MCHSEDENNQRGYGKVLCIFLYLSYVSYNFALGFNGPRAICHWTKKIPESLEESSRTKLQVTRSVELLQTNSKAGQIHSDALPHLIASLFLHSLCFPQPQPSPPFTMTPASSAVYHSGLLALSNSKEILSSHQNFYVLVPLFRSWLFSLLNSDDTNSHRGVLMTDECLFPFSGPFAL